MPIGKEWIYPFYFQQTGLFSLVIATGLEGKPLIQINFIPQNINLVSHPAVG